MELRSVNMCSSISEIICSNEGFIEFYEHSSRKMECIPKCPEQCETVDFETHHSFTQYSSNLLKSFSQNSKFGSLMRLFYNTSKIDMDLTRQSLTSLTIFYKKLTYDLYQEVPQVTTNDLLSKIGGVLGLLLGGSLISIFEVFVLIFELLISIIFTSIGRNSSTK